ncbi:hypothetical protein [Leptothermofonsia sp. ETS-13]|uniref:hypothetical protein n=1 Tax=Leptothermofonsia sp. ETS-13 TaxID=3035696 RepID=UPI003BA28577
MKRFIIALSPVLLVIASSIPALAETSRELIPQTRIEQQLQNSQLGPWLRRSPQASTSTETLELRQISAETSQHPRLKEQAPQTRIEQQLQNSQLGPWQR